MNDTAGGSGAFGFGDGPGLRGGGYEHLSAGGSNTAERVPIGRSGGAATGALRAVDRFVEIGLLDANIFPVDVEFFGDEHGERVFDALADFGIFGGDGEDVVRGNADERGRDEVLRGNGGLRKEIGQGIDVKGKEETTGGGGGCFEETATVELGGKHGPRSLACTGRKPETP